MECRGAGPRRLPEVQGYWDCPRKAGAAMLVYEDFREKIGDTLKRGSLTWTEIRTIAKLPRKFPNNKWVHQMEKDVGLKRSKDDHGVLRWKLQ